MGRAILHRLRRRKRADLFCYISIFQHNDGGCGGTLQIIGRPGMEISQPNHVAALFVRKYVCAVAAYEVRGKIAQAAAGVKNYLAARLLALRVHPRRDARPREYFDAMDFHFCQLSAFFWINSLYRPIVCSAMVGQANFSSTRWRPASP